MREDRGMIEMPKSVVLPAAMLSLAAAFLLLPPYDQQAAAQTATPFVNAVDLQINPASMSKFLAALADDGAATIKEAGTQEFVSSVGQKDQNHVFIYEVFNSSAAWDAHQKTTTYAKFIGITMMMIKNYNIRPFVSVAMNKSGAPQPPTDPPLLISEEELDIANGQTDKFIAAAKADAAASVQDPGCREFNIALSQTKDGHVLMFAAFDNAAALQAHQATDHFKAYQAAVKELISTRIETPLSSVAVLTKSQ
jgi:autoinducer 2-degrading protein